MGVGRALHMAEGSLATQAELKEHPAWPQQLRQCPTRYGEGIIASYPDPLRTCIWNAILERATDVHLHCVAEGLRVLHRVDGIIHPKLLLSPAEGRTTAEPVEERGRPDSSARFAPLEGQIVWPDEDMRWEIRVTLTPCGSRESAHLRFLSVPRDEWDVSGLGFLPADQERVSTSVRSLNGLVLITGATGSGKTTTMYCLASLRSAGHDDLLHRGPGRVPAALRPADRGGRAARADDARGPADHPADGPGPDPRGRDPRWGLVLVAARAALFRPARSGHDPRPGRRAGAIDALHYLGSSLTHIIGDSLRLVMAQKTLVRRLCPECSQPHELGEEDRELFTQYGVEAPDTLRRRTGARTATSTATRAAPVFSRWPGWTTKWRRSSDPASITASSPMRSAGRELVRWPRTDWTRRSWASRAWKSCDESAPSAEASTRRVRRPIPYRSKWQNSVAEASEGNP